jgi:parallel beta-helix repeat protein
MEVSLNRRIFLTVSAMASAAAATYCDPLLAQTMKERRSTSEGSAAGPKTTAFAHPGIIQTRAQLETMKRMIQRSEEPVATAWNRFMSMRASSLDFVPRPAAHILRSANGRERSGADEFSVSGQAAHSHALQWFVSRDAKHAEKAIEIIDAWSTTLWDFSGNDAKLLVGWTGSYFCEAAEILRATYPAWKQEARVRFQHLLTRVLVPLLSPFFPEANGNWDGAIMFSLMAMAIYLDDLALFNRVVEHYQYGYTNAGILKYVWPSGQCEESGRDQGHVQLGLGYFSYGALVASNQGVDLFAAGDDRLALGFEYTSRYMLGQDVPYFGVISPRARGRFSDFYEAAYQHYRFEKNLDMPYTAQAAASARASDRAISAVWLFRGGPENSPAKSLPLPDREGAAAGAHDQEPVANSAWHRIEAGQPLQDAIDRLENGGTILLGPGIHTLSDPLRLRNNLTILGCGRQTMVHLAAEASDYAIVQGSPKLENIVLRNFLIEGAASTEWPADPNQPRRERSTQMAASRGGIQLNGDAEGDLRNITLDHITVRNCAANGVEISGATGVKILSCNVTDSGGNNAPGHGLNHNLLVNHVRDCQVQDCRLVFSLGGCGISVQNSSGISVSGCELSRNWAYGAEFHNCRGATLQGSLLEANNAGAHLSATDGRPSPLSTSGLTERLNGSDLPVSCNGQMP